MKERLIIIFLISLVLISGCKATEIKKTETTSDKTICQNAHRNNLCDILDMTFSEGYKKLCCNNYEVCC